MPNAGSPEAKAAATGNSLGGAAPSREASADAEHSGVSAAERETMYRMYSHHVEVGHSAQLQMHICSAAFNALRRQHLTSMPAVQGSPMPTESCTPELCGSSCGHVRV